MINHAIGFALVLLAIIVVMQFVWLIRWAVRIESMVLQVIRVLGINGKKIDKVTQLDHDMTNVYIHLGMTREKAN